MSANRSPDPDRSRVLLTGASGYVGGRLLKLLEAEGFPVRCMARRPEYLKSRAGPATEVVAGDVLEPSSLAAALQGVETAFYLVHALGSEGSFVEREYEGARNFGRAAKEAGVRRIIYLGGLADESQQLSDHLRSRVQVGRLLAESGIPAIEFRASIVIGSGSLSFELIRALVERLPVMVTPRWVSVTAQPVAIEDVLAYLRAALSAILRCFAPLHPGHPLLGIRRGAGTLPSICRVNRNGSKRKDQPMAKRKTQPKSAPKRQRSPAQEAVHDAGKITGDLINALQTVRKSFLRVGQLLTEVRDRKHYLAIHDPDLETYASKRLDLSRASTYRFMKVYAWAKEHHPEWLDPEKKVRIPDLFEIEGLVWIEKELAEKKTDPGRKEKLEALKAKALAGKLPKKSLQAVQRRASKTDQGERKLISATRALRKRYAESKSAKAQECVPLFDRIIANMESDAVLETAALNILDDWLPKSDNAEFLSRNLQYA